MSEQFIYSQKNNFSGGELTPTIEGRTELGLYQNGAKKLSNFIILPSGGVVRRCGTRFVHLFESNVPRKIISVMFSRELSYLLVFEAHNDKTVCSFFVNGNLFLTSKVIMDGNQNFYFKPKDFSYTCFAGIAYISFGITRPIFKFSVDPAVVEEFYTHLASQQNTNNNNASVQATNFAGRDKLFIIEPLKAHVAYYKQMQNNSPVQRPFNEVIYNADIDKINDVLKGMHAAATSNIYEKKEEQLYASILVTFENRLWCFGVNKNMHLIWASYKGDFYDFRMSYKTLLEARNPLTALSATFSSSTFDNVLWAVPFSTEMLLGTTDGIYLIKEGDRSKGEFIKIHKELDVPVSPIKPVIIGKTIFFVEGSGTKINSLYYSQEKGGFQLSDITAYSEHIFNSGIRQIVGINSPFSMIFAVLKDGSFASFTYSQDLKIMGWTPHNLGGNNAAILSITAIFGETEDKLFVHSRRSDDIGSGYKEYLECLHPKYFTAKNNEMHKPSYLDCYVDITRPEEAALDHAIKQAIKDDSGSNTRGDTTKLENLVQQQATNILRLNVDVDNIPNKFKVSGILVSSLAANIQPQVKLFLQKYYNEQLPLIMELLASCFAFHRLIGQTYSLLLNVFSNEAGDLPAAKQVLNDAERLSNDIVIILNNITRQNLRIPAGINNNSLIDYLPNNAFSFNIGICDKIKLLDINLVKLLVKDAKEVISLTNSATDLQFERTQEMAELRNSTAELNKALISYYAVKDNDNKKDLLFNLQKFFNKNTYSFYHILNRISHPIVTPYIFGGEIKEFVIRELGGLTQNTREPQLKTKVKTVILNLIGKLEQKYDASKAITMAASKRQKEITSLLIAQLLEKNLSSQIKDFVLSKEFRKHVKQTIEQRYMADSSSDESEIEFNVTSHDENQSSIKVFDFMHNIQENLNILLGSIVDYAALIMPNNNKLLLKEIFENGSNIKLEKYLLLSKKYFPLFKKMFPNFSVHDLGNLARHCLPSFNQISVSWLPNIYKNNMVAILGDEELQELKIIDNELIKLKQPVRFLSVGFNYASVLQTFPFIFPDEVEHAPKAGVEIGVKVFNTKGGYIEEKLESGEIHKQHLNSKYVDSDDLVRFSSGNKYLGVSSALNLLSTPYKSGWVNFIMKEQIKQDVDFTFVVSEPYPASILKIYAKAKILPSYKGL